MVTQRLNSIAGHGRVDAAHAYRASGADRGETLGQCFEIAVGAGGKSPVVVHGQGDRTCAGAPRVRQGGRGRGTGQSGLGAGPKGRHHTGDPVAELLQLARSDEPRHVSRRRGRGKSLRQCWTASLLAQHLDMCPRPPVRCGRQFATGHSQHGKGVGGGRPDLCQRCVDDDQAEPRGQVPRGIGPGRCELPWQIGAVELDMCEVARFGIGSAGLGVAADDFPRVEREDVPGTSHCQIHCRVLGAGVGGHRDLHPHLGPRRRAGAERAGEGRRDTGAVVGQKRVGAQDELLRRDRRVHPECVRHQPDRHHAPPNATT